MNGDDLVPAIAWSVFKSDNVHVRAVPRHGQPSSEGMTKAGPAFQTWSKSAMMNEKTNPQIRRPLSKDEIEQIQKLTLSGVRQSVISRMLGITAPSVSKCQRALGLPIRPVIPEAKIMDLFE